MVSLQTLSGRAATGLAAATAAGLALCSAAAYLWSPFPDVQTLLRYLRDEAAAAVRTPLATVASSPAMVWFATLSLPSASFLFQLLDFSTNMTLSPGPRPQR